VDGRYVFTRWLDAAAITEGALFRAVNRQVLEDRLAHRRDPGNRVLLDHHGREIRLPNDRALWPDRERLEKRQTELIL
jgi:hypothetical protein